MFQLAKPIFLADKALEMNLQAGFTYVLNAVENKTYTLCMAASTYCRVTLNGKFVHYGPARGPHGYLRVDEVKLPVRTGENILAFEVAGYNCPSFYTINIRSFLQAEILQDGEVIAATDTDSGFKGIALDSYREQKVCRYSYQRAFTEVYYLDSPLADWQNNGFISEKLEISEHGLDYLPREFAYPEFKMTEKAKFVRSGIYQLRHKNQCAGNRIYVINDNVTGFKPEECPNDIFGATNADFTADDSTAMTSGRFVQYDLGQIFSGFVHTKIKVTSPAVVYAVFAERYVYDTEDINFSRGQLSENNIIKYRLPVGEYELESFEPYSFKHIALMVESGEVSEVLFAVREFCYPVKPLSVKTGDPILDKTVKAAYETFRQNTVDCYTDCPGRERGGWLCDSYFTGMSSFLFTGSTECERIFLDNFRLAKFPEGLPKGLLPMAYPGDNLFTSTIPQWTMWYVMELGGFGQRGGDTTPFIPLLTDIMAYFESQENSDGLLEKLPFWNFVEWSKANRWVQDVNYPTNMLYVGILRVAADILSRPELNDKADKVAKTVFEQSFDGEFFHDHAVRNADGKLVLLPDRSAICQHEAVLFDIIDPKEPTYQVFFNALVNSFGINGDASIAPADIEPLDLFIGYAVRVEVLMKLGFYELNLEEIKTLYGSMAEASGSLWEHRVPSDSLNHGFSSFVAVRIIDCLLGIRGNDGGAS